MGEASRGVPPLSVAVLAGGLSSRMGTDKALLSIVPGGPPLLARVLERVGRLTDDPMIVATGRPDYARFGVPIVADRYPGTGTLGGIATALEAARFDAVLVVGCDMPFLSVPLLAWMAAVPRDYDVLIPTLPGTSRQGRGEVYQTLHAIYGRRCLDSIRRQLDRGRNQVIGFFDAVAVVGVPEQVVRRHDPDLRSFFNANTPEAADEARRMLEKAG